MQRKSIFFILFLTLYGCQSNNKEIPPCNLSVDNGITYTNNKVYSGTCNIFYNDSILWKTRTYKKGWMTEEKGFYLDGGQLEYIGKQKKGVIHGDFISYYPNGEVSIEGYIKDGQYDGDWIYYDDDGSLNKTLIWMNGEKIDSIGHK